MSDWDELVRELDAWGEAGRTATFWWRDDDAARPTSALDQLLALNTTTDAPLALAVIPAIADSGLRARLAQHRRQHPGMTVLQHGHAHRNHAAAGEKKSEFGAGRSQDEVATDLAAGFRRLADYAGFVPVLVPPWNRIADQWFAALPGLGFRGLSAFGPRPSRQPVAGLRQVNTHIDIMDWRGDRGFIGAGDALGAALTHLRRRRQRHIDADEPTGLLTHHRVHDDAAWRFVADFLTRASSHTATAWLNASEMFG